MGFTIGGLGGIHHREHREHREERTENREETGKNRQQSGEMSASFPSAYPISLFSVLCSLFSEFSVW
jgi:hypothetical protein